jgi:hypothetical protein
VNDNTVRIYKQFPNGCWVESVDVETLRYLRHAEAKMAAGETLQIWQFLQKAGISSPWPHTARCALPGAPLLLVLSAAVQDQIPLALELKYPSYPECARICDLQILN